MSKVNSVENEIVVKSHEIKSANFSNALSRIENFTKNKKKQIEFEPVKTEAFFSIFAHKVTGEELNSVIEKVQKNLSHVHENYGDLVNEFTKVYEAFSALDKEYIAGIVSAIKSVEHVNEKVLIAQKYIKKNQDGLKGTQGELKSTIQRLDKTVQVLSKFKNDLDKVKRLKDADSMWNKIEKYETDFQRIEQTLITLTASDEMLEEIEHLEEIDEMWEGFEEHKRILSIFDKILDQYKAVLRDHDENIIELINYKNELMDIKYLNEVDKTWDDTQTLIKQMEKVNEELLENTRIFEQHNADLKVLFKHKEKLEKINHLEEIDSMYKEIQENKTTITNLEEEIIKLTEGEVALENRIKENEESHKIEMIQISKKLKIAYWIGGGSLGLSGIHLLLSVVGVI